MKFEEIGKGRWTTTKSLGKAILIDLDWEKLALIRRNGLGVLWLVPRKGNQFNCLAFVSEVLDPKDPVAEGKLFDEKNLASILSVKKLLAQLTEGKADAMETSESAQTYTISFLILLVESLVYLSRNKNPDCFLHWLKKQQEFDQELTGILITYLNGVTKYFLPVPVIYEPKKKG